MAVNKTRRNVKAKQQKTVTGKKFFVQSLKIGQRAVQEAVAERERVQAESTPFSSFRF